MCRDVMFACVAYSVQLVDKSFWVERAEQLRKPQCSVCAATERLEGEVQYDSLAAITTGAITGNALPATALSDSLAWVYGVLFV